MNRIGPYGDGSNNNSIDGTLDLKWRVKSVKLDVAHIPSRVLYRHGGSRNIAARDGEIAVLGESRVIMLDPYSLNETRSFPTIVKAGGYGWDLVWTLKADGSPRGLMGHSVPSGLSTVYWFANGWLSVRPGGDIGTRPEGSEVIRVTDDAPPVPTIPHAPNQREFFGAHDRNSQIIYCLNGHGHARPHVGVVNGKAAAARTVINNPTFLSTPSRHFTIAPATTVRDKKGFFSNGTGVLISTVPGGEVYKNEFIHLYYSNDGYYSPQPWCLQNDNIFLVSAAGELWVLNTETWDWVKYPLRSPTIPRLAVNRHEMAVVLTYNSLERPCAWKKSVSLAAELPMQNIQCANHIVVDDTKVYLGRLIKGQLKIDSFSLKDGFPGERIDIPIPFADETGQLVDFCSVHGALYALVSVTERDFHQVLVCVS